MKKTNILFLTRWFPNAANPTHCVFVQRMLDALSENSDTYSYTVISPSPYLPHFLSRLFPRWGNAHRGAAFETGLAEYQVLRPKYFKLPYSLLFGLEWFFYFVAVKLLIKRENLKFDIIHTHGLFPDAYVAVNLGRELGIPVLVHVHDSMVREGMFKKHRSKLDIIMRDSALIVAVSDFQRKIIAELYPEFSNKILTVYNGVNMSKFSLPERKPRLNINPCKLIYVGNLIKIKRVDTLIHAVKSAAAVMDVSLDIYGEGPESGSCHALVEELGVRDIISFKGVVSNDILSSILSKYSFLIQPSDYETFGIVLVEAMACGIPVVCFKTGALPEIVTSDVLGIMAEEKSAEALSRAIVLASKREWNRVKLRDYAVAKFSLAKNVESVEALYAQILLKANNAADGTALNLEQRGG